MLFCVNFGSLVAQSARARIASLQPWRARSVGVGVALNLPPVRSRVRDEPATTGTLTTTSATPAVCSALFFFAGPLFFRARSGRRARLVKDPRAVLPFQGHRRKRGERPLPPPSLLPFLLSLLSSVSAACGKSAPLPSFSEAVADGREGEAFFWTPITLPLPSPGPELWAPDAAPRVWRVDVRSIARPWLSRTHRGPSPFWGHRTSCCWGGPGVVDPGPVWRTAVSSSFLFE